MPIYIEGFLCTEKGVPSCVPRCPEIINADIIDGIVVDDIQCI